MSDTSDFLANLNSAIRNVDEEKKYAEAEALRIEAEEQERERKLRIKNSTPEGRHDIDVLSKRIDLYFASKQNLKSEVYSIAENEIDFDEDVVDVAGIFKVFDNIGYKKTVEVEHLIALGLEELLALHDSKEEKKNRAILLCMLIIEKMGESLVELCRYRTGILKKFSIGNDNYYEKINNNFIENAKSQWVPEIGSDFYSPIKALGEALVAGCQKSDLRLDINYKGQYYSLDSIIASSFRYSSDVSHAMFSNNVRQFGGEMAVEVIEIFFSSVLNKIIDLSRNAKLLNCMKDFFEVSMQFSFFMAQWISNISFETKNELIKSGKLKINSGESIAYKYRSYLNDYITSYPDASKEEIIHKTIISLRLDPTSIDPLLLLRDYCSYNLSEIYCVAEAVGKKVEFESKMFLTDVYSFGINASEKKELTREEFIKHKILYSTISNKCNLYIACECVRALRELVENEKNRYEEIDRIEYAKDISKKTSDLYLSEKWENSNLDFSFLFRIQYENHQTENELKSNCFLYENPKYNAATNPCGWNYYKGQLLLYDACFVMTDMLIWDKGNTVIFISDICGVYLLYSDAYSKDNMMMCVLKYGKKARKCISLHTSNAHAESANVVRRLSYIFKYFYPENQLANEDFKYCPDCNEICNIKSKSCPKCKKKNLMKYVRDWEGGAVENKYKHNYVSLSGLNNKRFSEREIPYLNYVKENHADMADSIEQLDSIFRYWKCLNRMGIDIGKWRYYDIDSYEDEGFVSAFCEGTKYSFEIHESGEVVYFCNNCLHTFISLSNVAKECPNCHSFCIDNKKISKNDWEGSEESKPIVNDTLIKKWEKIAERERGLTKCHNCGKKYTKSDDKCIYCGEPNLSLEIECETCGKMIKKGMKFCNFCGETNLLYEEECAFCGKRIRKGAKYCNSCGKLNAAYEEKCIFCGKKIKNGTKFCNFCGKEQVGKNTNVEGLS